MRHNRVQWRSSVSRWWSQSRFLILMVLGLLSLILGLIGFIKNGIAHGENRTILDNIYLMLGLLSMNSGAVPGPVSWELQVARFSVPAITAYTALLALAMIFTQQLQQVRLLFIRDHIIICGLGRKGFRLAKQFRDRGEKVVIIEVDEGNNRIDSFRSSGIIVISGDASDPNMLIKVRLNRAKYLISVIGDEGKNAEVAVQAEKISHDRDIGILNCIIHIADHQLWYLLREKELYVAQNSHFRLELFNIFDRGANLLIKLHSPWKDGFEKTDCTNRLILIGLGKLGQSLVVQAALQWREQRIHPGQRLRITIIDLDAVHMVDNLCVRYPHLEEVCEFEPLQMDVLSAHFQRADFLYNDKKVCDIDSIYICMDNDSLGLHTGLTLYQKIRDHNIPVIVRMVEDAGLALLLHEKGINNGAYKNLYAFPLLDQTCTPDLILRGTHEILARELHEAYLKGLDEQQIADGGDLVLAAWDDLQEDSKEKNRKQADRIALILDKHDYRIAPLTDWKMADTIFSAKDDAEKVEAMARMEHEMWCQEMLADDWQHGSIRSKKHKTNPALVSWETLRGDGTKNSDEFNKNIKFILDLPKVLARAGFQIEQKNFK